MRFLILLLLKFTSCLIPPEYSIDLKTNMTFLISDMFDSDDAEDFNSDEIELIKPRDLVKHRVEESKVNDPKYYMLHKLVNRKNRQVHDALTQRTATKQASRILKAKYPESQYPDAEEPDYAYFMKQDTQSRQIFKKAIESNFTKNNKSENLSNNNTNINEMSVTNETGSDFNYEELKKEYESAVKEEKNDTKFFKYENLPDKETPKEAVKNIFNFRWPENCTIEEMKGIGLNTILCFFKDFRNLNEKSNRGVFFRRVLKVVLIWVIVYIAIAIPCWCARGWCCCCFRCRFCKPHKTIDEAKKFISENPLGVFHVDGQEVKYTPTPYEKYAQKQLEQALMKL